MFDNANPYTLRTEADLVITRYFISFADGQAVVWETEISHPVYLEFLNFIKIERNLRRWDERHIEQSGLRDETLYNREFDHSKSIEDAACDSLRDEQLWLAIDSLPEIQQRRFILYYEFGLAYEQIAEIEGCTKRAVKFSVDLAKQKVCEKIENF